MTLRGSKWTVMLLKFLPGMTQQKTTSFPLSPPSCRQLPRTSKEYQIRSFAFLHLNLKCSIKCLLRSWPVPDLITAAGTSHLNLSSSSPSPAHRPGANIPFFFLVLPLSFMSERVRLLIYFHHSTYETDIYISHMLNYFCACVFTGTAQATKVLSTRCDKPIWTKLLFRPTRFRNNGVR